jgi:hypothetical protein
MSRSFNGTTDYLSYAGAVDAAHPMSFALWFNKPSTTFATAFSISNTNVSNPNRNSIILSNIANVRAFSANSGGTTTAGARSTATFSTNTWHHACAVFSSNSSRTIYLDGGNSATNTTTVGVNTGSFVATTIGGFSNSGSIGQPYDGLIAEVAVWNGNLTADDAATLAKGISPLLVRPDILVAYWPLYGNASPEVELRNRYEMTVNGTTKDVQPRIFLPARSFYPQLILQNVNVPVTGVEATGAVGTATASSSLTQTVTGQSATGAVGTVTTIQNVDYTVTGQSATGQVGTVTTAQNVDYTVAGQSATGAVGTPTVSTNVTLTTDSVFATGQVGAVTTAQNVDYTVTGQFATGQVGTPTVIIGQLVTTDSVFATGQVGTVTTAQNVDYTVTGQSATGAIGTVSFVQSSTIAVTGVSSTGAVGGVEVLTPVPSVYAIGKVGVVIVWTPITPNQNAGWTPVDDSQSGGWTPVDDSNTVSWQKVA